MARNGIGHATFVRASHLAGLMLMIMCQSSWMLVDAVRVPRRGVGRARFAKKEASLRGRWLEDAVAPPPPPVPKDSCKGTIIASSSSTGKDKDKDKEKDNVALKFKKTCAPSASPSVAPSGAPSISNAPTVSKMPSTAPSVSKSPSTAPSLEPSSAPSLSPTSSPTVSPSTTPSVSPTQSPPPTREPTATPTDTPTAEPTALPTWTLPPTIAPTATSPTIEPTMSDDDDGEDDNDDEDDDNEENDDDDEENDDDEEDDEADDDEGDDDDDDDEENDDLNVVVDSISTLDPSPSPTSLPTAAATPTPSEVPSLAPSLVPTVVPTISVMPSTEPTITGRPTGSASPTVSRPPSAAPTTSTPPTTAPSIEIVNVNNPDNTNIARETGFWSRPVSNDQGDVGVLSQCRETPAPELTRTDQRIDFDYSVNVLDGTDAIAALEHVSTALHRRLEALYLTCGSTETETTTSNIFDVSGSPDSSDESSFFVQSLNSLPTDSVNQDGCDGSDTIEGTICIRVTGAFTAQVVDVEETERRRRQRSLQEDDATATATMIDNPAVYDSFDESLQDVFDSEVLRNGFPQIAGTTYHGINNEGEGSPSRGSSNNSATSDRSRSSMSPAAKAGSALGALAACAILAAIAFFLVMRGRKYKDDASYFDDDDDMDDFRSGKLDEIASTDLRSNDEDDLPFVTTANLSYESDQEGEESGFEVNPFSSTKYHYDPPVKDFPPPSRQLPPANFPATSLYPIMNQYPPATQPAQFSIVSLNDEDEDIVTLEENSRASREVEEASSREGSRSREGSQSRASTDIVTIEEKSRGSNNSAGSRSWGRSKRVPISAKTDAILGELRSAERNKPPSPRVRGRVRGYRRKARPEPDEDEMYGVPNTVDL